MTVELRIVTPAQAQAPLVSAVGARGMVIRTEPSQERDLDIQKVYVMNGEKAQVKMGRSMPLQWVKTAAARSESSGTAGGDRTNVDAQAVENATSWMESGQGMVVLVRWPGGKQMAVVEVEVDTSAVDTHPAQNLPHQLRQRVSSKVVMPLGEWTTVAITGPKLAPVQAGVYSTRALETETEKWVQLRVLAP